MLHRKLLMQKHVKHISTTLKTKAKEMQAQKLSLLIVGEAVLLLLKVAIEKVDFEAGTPDKAEEREDTDLKKYEPIQGK